MPVWTNVLGLEFPACTASIIVSLAHEDSMPPHILSPAQEIAGAAKPVVRGPVTERMGRQDTSIYESFPKTKQPIIALSKETNCVIFCSRIPHSASTLQAGTQVDWCYSAVRAWSDHKKNFHIIQESRVARFCTLSTLRRRRRSE